MNDRSNDDAKLDEAKTVAELGPCKGGEAVEATETETPNNDKDATPTNASIFQQQLSLEEVKRIQCRRTLNFSASDVAAISGFHPYKNLPQLVFRLVYAGSMGAILQRMDAQAIGLVVEYVTEEQVWKSLAAQAGASTTKALEKAISGKATQTVQEAQTLKADIVQKAKMSGKLKPAELKVLQEGTRQVVNTRFGNHHEDNALDHCETRFGWEIYDRNQEIMEWRFRKVEDPASGSVVVEPMGAARPGNYNNYRGRRFRQNDEAGNDSENASSQGKRQKIKEGGGNTVDLTDENDGDNTAINRPEDEVSKIDENRTKPVQGECLDGKLPAEEVSSALAGSELSKGNREVEDTKVEINTTTLTSKTDPTFFVIRGSVDGRRDELIPSSSKTVDEFDDWEMRPVIVELKHRMNRLFSSPPLYEQIQAVTYCLMYRVTEADLVQAIRIEEKIGSKKRKNSKEEGDKVAARKKEAESDNASTKNTIENFFPPKTGVKTEESKTESMMKSSQIEANLAEKDKQVGTTIEASDEAENRDPNQSIAIESKEFATADIPSKSVAKDHSERAAKYEGSGDAPTQIDTSKVATEDTKGAQADNTAETEPKVRSATDKESQAEIGVVTTDAAPKDSKSEANRLPQKKTLKPKLLSIKADRISLDDPTYRHGKNWHDVILPHLGSFASAVYSIREDDSKRYRLLLACSDPLGQLEEDAWELLFEECQWLKDCDTAFRRGGR